MPAKGQITGKASHNRLDLVGQRFTRLTVLSFAGIQKTRHRESLWACKCDCGNEITTSGWNLRSGGTKSCGCYHKDHTRELFSFPDETIRVNRIMLDYRKSARRRNLPFELTRDQMSELMDKPCFYCGAEPSNSLVQHGKQIRPYQGIDRLDNSKGYVMDNIVPCCIICNKMKKAMNETEFMSHVRAIVSRREVVTPQSSFRCLDPAEVWVL